VSIVEVYQNLVWVGGDVRKPGFVDYRPGLTATQALAQAGGANDSAAVDTCLVLQRTGREQYRSSRLNLLKALQEGDANADPILAPQDVIFIPKTAIAKAEALVDQSIVKMIPTRFTANSDAAEEIGSTHDNSDEMGPAARPAKSPGESTSDLPASAGHSQ
jgi:protein involved in polysaccharide export with SLBB domain